MKKINVTRSSMPCFDEYCGEIRDLWDSVWLTNMGSKLQRLQAELTQYLGAENMDLLTNGHMAIELSLQAMELRGEVITTPFTFASTTQAIVRRKSWLRGHCLGFEAVGNGGVWKCFPTS